MQDRSSIVEAVLLVSVTICSDIDITAEIGRQKRTGAFWSLKGGREVTSVM
jgi:hypothetical protein